MLIGSARPSFAWQFVEAMNMYGDSATGVVQAARDTPGVVLAIGCDGDRFRVVAVGPPAGGGIKLDPDGQVRISFGAEPGPKEKWQVIKRVKGRIITYLAPAASDVVRQMLEHEKANADAVFNVGVLSAGKPVDLVFPLGGLRAAIRKDLWEPCKLSNDIPESEFDRQ